jgi:hypothetical protein
VIKAIAFDINLPTGFYIRATLDTGFTDGLLPDSNYVVGVILSLGLF